MIPDIAPSSTAELASTGLNATNSECLHHDRAASNTRQAMPLYMDRNAY